MQTNTNEPREKDLKLYSVFTGLFVAVLLVGNITSSKLFQLGPFALPGGIVLFPIAFIFNDILTEVYGYQRSRKVIWIGFSCQLLAALTYLLVGILPPAGFWKNQAAYDVILGFVPRLAIASMIAYFCGELANSFVLSKMKYFAQGKRGLSQASRFITSTIVGEGVDTIVVMVIAFAGVLATSDLLHTAINLYVFKVLYEIVATPISTRFSNWVKEVEGLDAIDYPERTNYNPFILAGESKAGNA